MFDRTDIRERWARTVPMLWCEFPGLTFLLEAGDCLMLGGFFFARPYQHDNDNHRRR